MKQSEEPKNQKIDVVGEYADIRKAVEKPASFSESLENTKKKAEEESEKAKERTKTKILRVLSYSGVKEEEKLSAQKIEEIVRGDVGKTLETLKAEIHELEARFSSAPKEEKKTIEKVIEKKEERIRSFENAIQEKTSVGGAWVDLAKYGSVPSEEEIKESVTGGKKISDIAHPAEQKDVSMEVNWEPMIQARFHEVKTVSELEDAMRFAFQKIGEKSVGEREKAFTAALSLRRAIEEEKALQFNTNLFPERFRPYAKQVMDRALLFDDEEFNVEKPAFLKKATDKSFKIESVGSIKDLSAIIALKISKEEGITENGKKYSYDALQNKLVILNEYLKNNESKGGRLPQYLATLAESFPAYGGIRDALEDVIKVKGFSLTEPLKTAAELAQERGGEIAWEEKAPRTIVEEKMKESEVMPISIPLERKNEISNKPVYEANDFAKTARENQEGIRNPKAFPFAEDERKEAKTIPSKVEREEDAFGSMEDIFKFLAETSQKEKEAEGVMMDKQIGYKNARIAQWRALIDRMHTAKRKAFSEETRQIRSVYSFSDWDKKEKSERDTLNAEKLANLREVFLRYGLTPYVKEGKTASPDNPWEWRVSPWKKDIDMSTAKRYTVSYEEGKPRVEKEGLDIDPTIEKATTVEAFEDVVTALMEKGPIIERGNELPPEAMPALFGALEMYCENPDGDFYADGWPERHGIRATAKRIAESAKNKIEKNQTVVLEKVHAETPDFSVGDEVLWESNGVSQWKEPKKIKSIHEDPKSKRKYAFVEGETTGISLDELILFQVWREKLRKMIKEGLSSMKKRKIEESAKAPDVVKKSEKKEEDDSWKVEPSGFDSLPKNPVTSTVETPVNLQSPESPESPEIKEKESALTPAQKINALIVLGILSEADQARIPTGDAEKETFLKEHGTEWFEWLSKGIKEEKNFSGKKKKGGVEQKKYVPDSDAILKKASEVWEKRHAFNSLYKDKVLKSMVERKLLSETKYALCDDAEKALSGAMTDLNKLLERGWRGRKEDELGEDKDKEIEKEIRKDAELVVLPFGKNEKTGKSEIRSFRWMMINMNRLAYDEKSKAEMRGITEAWPKQEKKSFFERIPLAGRAVEKFNKLPKWAKVAASTALISGIAGVGGGLVAGLSLGSLLGFMGIKVVRGVGGGIGGGAFAGVLGKRIEKKSSETLVRDEEFIKSTMASDTLREAQNENYLTNIRLKKYDDIAKLSTQIGERLSIAENLWRTSSRERVLKSEKFRKGFMMLCVALLAGGGTVAVTELLAGGADALANIKLPNLNIDPNSMKTINPDMLEKIARDIQKGI